MSPALSSPVLAAALIFGSAVVPLPGPGFGALVVAAGAAFGVGRGFAVVYPAAVLGSAAAFGLGRLCASDRLRARAPKILVELQGALAAAGLPTLLALRLTPLPLALSNLFLGSIPTVRFADFAGATALGFCRLVANVYLGAQLGELGASALSSTASADGGEHRLALALQLCGALAAIVSISGVGRALLKNRSRDAAEAAGTPARR